MVALKARVPSQNQGMSTQPKSSSFAERYRRDGVPALVRATIAHLLAATENSFASDVAKRDWPNDPDLPMLLRAAVNPATTTTSGWASSFAATAVADLFKSMGGASAGALLLNRGMQLNFDGAGAISVPSIVASADNVGFVQEAAPIPVGQLDLDGPTLSPRKFATIMTFTREVLSRSTPNVEAVVRAVLTESTGLALDAALFSNTAGDATRPPGLLYGIAAETASAATSPSEAMAADITTLASAVAPIAGNTPIIFIASPARAVRFKVRRENVSYEVLTSAALADGVLIAVAANAVASALDPVPRFKLADQATLHMDTAAAALSVVGTPPVVSAPARSLWQADSLALRMILDVAWTLRNANGVAWMEGATW